MTKATLITFAIVLAHCGGASTIGGSSSSTQDGDSDSGSTSNTVVGGSVSEVSIENSSVTVTLEDLGSDDDVLLLIYSSSDSSQTTSFQVDSLSSASESAAFLQKSHDEVSFLETDQGAVLDDTEAFHQSLREWENQLEDDSLLISSSSNRYLRQVFLSVGSEKVFKVLNSFSGGSNYDEVTATLRHQSSSFNFYVDNRDAASLTDDDLEELAEEFEGVLDEEHSMFGTESDVDEDGRFAVLFTRTVNGIGGSSGGVVTGFFYAIDLFSSARYSVSNEMEVFYTFVPDPNGDYGASISKSFAMSNIYPGVLVHEFQHMINFNQHYFENNSSAEEGWLNEALSHLAEDIHSIDSQGYMQETGIENHARVASFLNDASSICMTCGTSLSQRGQGYLFLRYLYERAEAGDFSGVTSGSNFVSSLVQTGARGIDNVVDVLYGSSGDVSNFRELYGQFGLAIYLSNTDQSSNDIYQFDGIDLRASAQDNRGTVHNGPAIQEVSSFPFTDSLSSNNLSYIRIPASLLQEVGGQLILNFSNQSNLGAYFIRE
ncbi:MAG: hypothetical protein H7A33_08450 [Deltaproteobacteria bacterium]|nr:hypothetical protein [Deltaproteobacteria bacterium]